jgi:hypothetical protein
MEQLQQTHTSILIFIKVLVSCTVEYCSRKTVIYFASVTSIAPSNRFRAEAGRRVRCGIARCRTRADGSFVGTLWSGLDDLWSGLFLR